MTYLLFAHKVLRLVDMAIVPCRHFTTFYKLVGESKSHAGGAALFVWRKCSEVAQAMLYILQQSPEFFNPHIHITLPPAAFSPAIACSYLNTSGREGGVR